MSSRDHVEGFAYYVAWLVRHNVSPDSIGHDHPQPSQQVETQEEADRIIDAVLVAWERAGFGMCPNRGTAKIGPRTDGGLGVSGQCRSGPGQKPGDCRGGANLLRDKALEVLDNQAAELGAALGSAANQTEK